MRFFDALEEQGALIRFWASAAGAERAEQFRETLLLTRGMSPSAEHLRQMHLHELTRAQPFYVSADLVPLILAGADGLPGGTSLRLDMLPDWCGWVYLARPVAMPALPIPGWLCAVAHDQLWLEGFTWQHSEIRPPGARIGTGETTHVSFTAYVDHRRCLGRLDSLSMLDWPVGEPWDGWSVKESGAGNVRERANQEIVHRQGEQWRRLILAFFLFVQQEILTTRQERAPRHVRRRLFTADSPEPTVRVVQLRRTHPRDGRWGESESREWSCQWLVRGHWRRQWMARSKAHQPRWIAPHVKGDPSKPLRAPSTNLFAVVR